MEGEMKYPEEYVKALATLKRDDWPLLKKHLCTTDADLVLAALNTYLEAFGACKDARDTFDKYTFDCTGPVEEVREHMDEIIRLRKVYHSAKDTQDVTYSALMVQMLGQEIYGANFGR